MFTAPARPKRWDLVRRVCGPTLRYWMETEVHVYAFSVAANILLSFFPFLIVTVSLCRYVLHWEAAVQAIYLALRDYFPEEMGQFITRNLDFAVRARGPLQFGSMLLLLFTANGIFEPLEVALNRVWGVTKNRSFLHNQMVSLGLIFACGSLFLLSIFLTAANTGFFSSLLGPGQGNRAAGFVGVLVFKLAALPVTVFMLWLMYWLLPNRPVRPLQVLPTAIVIGIALELLKYVTLLIWPWFHDKLQKEYGPFINSAALIFWGFAVSMIILAGAEWAARGASQVADEQVL